MLKGFLCAPLVLSLTTIHSEAQLRKGSCNPNGTANEVIGCLHNANVDQSKNLNKRYSKYLDSIFETCAKKNTGGGSGGFDDRTRCVTEALGAEEKRINSK
jgi:uncharacterized protein YecT (DUF1311 family)